jgi:UDP-3-O-[3-hydroxymyristoyl] N-acetylglucosamine deacetylase
MAAFAGVGINNALIEVDGPEVPAMDGSAAPFVNLLQKAGLKTQKEPIQYIEILEPVIVKKGDKLLSIEPCKDFIVSFEIEFEHPLIAKQRFVDKITPQTFAHKISKARTFGFLNEVELLRENGFALGGSLDNAVVMSDTSIYNSGGLRFSDEFVRHKVLDLIGDLYLLGAPILGRVKAVKSGHSLHHVFNQELLRHLYSWEYSEHESGWLIPSWFGQKEDMVSAIVSA